MVMHENKNPMNAEAKMEYSYLKKLRKYKRIKIVLAVFIVFFVWFASHFEMFLYEKSQWDILRIDNGGYLCRNIFSYIFQNSWIFSFFHWNEKMTKYDIFRFRLSVGFLILNIILAFIIHKWSRFLAYTIDKEKTASNEYDKMQMKKLGFK